MSDDVAFHVYIRGRVQRVWFRGWATQEAITLGLRGWVRNIPDGRVEAVFSGEPMAVKKMLKQCETGPPMARVDSVEKSEISVPSDMIGFERR